MDALGCPPGDWPVTNLSGGEKRRVALCKLLIQAPDLPPPRRAHQPPRRRVGEPAGAAPSKYAGARRRGHPRPATSGNVAEWILEASTAAARSPTRATTPPTSTRRPPASRSRAARTKAPEAPRGTAGSGRGRTPKGANQAQGPSRPVPGDGGRGRQDAAGLRGDPDPAGPAPRFHRRRGRAPLEGVRRQGPHRRPVLRPVPERHRRRHRPQRRGQDHAVQDDPGPADAAQRPRSRSATRSRSRTSTSPAPTSTRRRPLGSLGRWTATNVGQVEMPSRAYVSAFGFKGPDEHKPAGALRW
ncbi:hypothetical protein SCALM49S_03407 [Streptomyces californicus]